MFLFSGVSCPVPVYPPLGAKLVGRYVLNSGHFQIRGKPEFIGSCVGLVPRNAHLIIHSWIVAKPETIRKRGRERRKTRVWPNRHAPKFRTSSHCSPRDELFRAKMLSRPVRCVALDSSASARRLGLDPFAPVHR